MKILVIAAHPDDEVLGMGATIKKLAKKNHTIHLCVVSEGASAQYQDEKMIKVRKDACVKAGKFLGISQFTFLKFIIELFQFTCNLCSHIFQFMLNYM